MVFQDTTFNFVNTQVYKKWLCTILYEDRFVKWQNYQAGSYC
jgi:hypothetical protein